LEKATTRPQKEKSKVRTEIKKVTEVQDNALEQAQKAGKLNAGEKT